MVEPITLAELHHTRRQIRAFLAVILAIHQGLDEETGAKLRRECVEIALSLVKAESNLRRGKSLAGLDNIFERFRLLEKALTEKAELMPEEYHQIA